MGVQLQLSLLLLQLILAVSGTEVVSSSSTHVSFPPSTHHQQCSSYNFPPELLISPIPTSRTPVNFLITGCPRSGTRFIANFLNLNGLRVSHERFRGDTNNTDEGIVSWVMGADTDNAPWGPSSRNFSFTHIIHQVRNPLGAIGSILRNEHSRSWDYVCQLLPQIQNCIVQRSVLGKYSLVERSAAFWYYWNLLAEQKSELTYSIDSFSQTTLTQIETVLGLSKGRLQARHSRTVSRRAAGRSYRSLGLSWRELYFCTSRPTFDNVTCLGGRYGFNITGALELQQNPPNVDNILARWVVRVSNKLPSFSRVHLSPRQLWTRLCCQGYAHNGAMCSVAFKL